MQLALAAHSELFTEQLGEWKKWAMRLLLQNSMQKYSKISTAKGGVTHSGSSTKRMYLRSETIEVYEN